MKRIIILCFIALTFYQCGKDETLDINTIEIDGQDYIMPKIYIDIDQLKNYLYNITSDVAISEINNTKKITAKLNKDQSKIFTEFTYQLTNNNGFESVVFSYKYRDIDFLKIKDKKKIVEFLNKETAIIF